MESSALYVNKSTPVLLVRLLVAAAWIDGDFDPRERRFLEQVIEKSRLSETEKEMAHFYMEEPPSEEESQVVLEELCGRSASKKEKRAIGALLEKLFAAEVICCR